MNRQFGHREQISSDSNVPSGRVVIALASLYFVSGIVALIYEVLWQRQFSLVFGSAASATAAVLASYFTGLALGGFVLGRFAKKWKRPLIVYAILEVIIAIGALSVAPILKLFDQVQPWFLEHLPPSVGMLFALKLGWSFISILVPTFCMGGTLPVLGVVVDQGQRKLGASVGLLYAINTLGAALGALAVPFILLRSLGATASVGLCVTVNFALAAGACWLQKFWNGTNETVNRETVSEREFVASRMMGSVLLFSFLSGFFSFVLQVVWNRAFAQIHENSIYSFAIVVSFFIVALATGAQIARYFLMRAVAPLRLLGWSWLLGGAAVALTPFLFLKLTNGLNYIPTAGGWVSYGLNLAALSAAVLLVPISLLGIGFPALMEQGGYLAKRSVSLVLGELITANMAGSVVGALSAGFVLPHWLGMWQSILAISLLLVVTGISQLRVSYQGKWGFFFCAALSCFSAIACWGIGKIDLARVRIDSGQGEQLESIWEGAHGVVAVVQRPGSLRLKLNNYYVLGGTLSAGDERMQAHIPLLLHPAPVRAAVLGLGTGITAGGTSFHSVQHLTAVELVPEVVDAARHFFSEPNQGILDRPQTHLVLDDARNFLRTTPAKFDLIIGDLVVPWRQGEGSLLTLENFTAARSALAPGGLYCQWIPLFQLSETELEILIRTFLQVFPRVSIWRGDFSPDQQSMALIGTLDSFNSDSKRVDANIREMKMDPLNLHLVNSIGLWMYFIGTIERQNLSKMDERINREDRPWVELIGPLKHSGEETTEVCTGRRLQRLISVMKQQAMGRNLNDEQVQGGRAGDLLYEFTLSLSEGDERAAAVARSELKAILPNEVYTAVFPQ